MSEDEIWDLDKQREDPIEIHFDDGVLHTRAQPTIFSWYIWQLFRDYDKAPILIKHHIRNTRVSANTHLNFFTEAVTAIFEAYNKKVDMDALSKRIYELTNDMFNAFVLRLEEEVTSIDILDFLEIVEHPKISKIIEGMKPNAKDIERAYAEAREVMLDPTELQGNANAEAMKSGLVKDNAVIQCVIARGAMADIDANIFRRPILDSYTTGLTGLSDSMMESRAASKAQLNTTGPVRDAEYFNRIEQLISSFVVGVETENGEPVMDCGSVTYREYCLTASDFKDWVGKYYLDELSQTIKVLRASDRHLVDQVVKFRSLFDCKVPDRRKLCQTCYGDLYYNIPVGANLGHTGATATCKDVSQIIISTKHYAASAMGEEINYGDYELKYVRLGTDPNHILLNKRLKSFEEVSITISAEEANRLSEIMTADLSTLSIRRISSVSEIRIDYKNQMGTATAVIPVSMGTQHSSLSKSFLEYLKKERWELTEQGNYLIDMKNWNYTDVAFVMPMKQMSMMDFFLTIEYILKSKTTDGAAKRTIIPGIKHLKKIGDPWEGLLYLHHVVQQKFQINIVHLEIMVQALRVMNLKEKDYRIPTGAEYGQIGDFNEVIGNRSLGAKLAYQNIMDIFDSPMADIIDNRHPHPMDQLLMGDRLE
jgi:hypothetical protein